MAHFAEIDLNNIVKRVLVVPDDQQARGQDFLSIDLRQGGYWVQTSYNSRGGVHYTEVMTDTKKIKSNITVHILSSGSLTSSNTNYMDLSAGPLSAVPLSSIILTNIVSSRNVTIPIYTLSADGKPHIRYNFAGPGFYYDSVRDAFIPPKPYNSWVLEASSCLWVAPISYPTDGSIYIWDEPRGWLMTMAASALTARPLSSTHTPGSSSIN